MPSLDIESDQKRLLLNATTQILAESFNKMSKISKIKFISRTDTKLNIRTDELELKRRLWNVKEPENTTFQRVIVRSDILGTGANKPKIVAKAGLTENIGDKNDLGLVIGYGWNQEIHSPRFEGNIVREMNKATDGVKIYYGTPGERSILGKLGSPRKLEKYVD